MSYLLDKKLKKKKVYYTLCIVFSIIILLYFRLDILSGFSATSHKIFRPVLVSVSRVGENLASVRAFFISKNSLYLENENLKSKLNEQTLFMLNYSALLSENRDLKSFLSRSDEEKNIILGSVLGRLNQSLYDTFIIDLGTEDGLAEGDTVFALPLRPLALGEAKASVPIGRVGAVYAKSSKVILFSNAGEKMEIIMSTGEQNIFMELVGRGGGNFEMILPRDFKLSKGDKVFLPGIVPYVVGIVETTISDPRDSFNKVLLVSPVNAREIKFVLIKK